jgi:3-oxoadipate enol-lactonase
VSPAARPEAFRVDAGGLALAGEASGAGPPIVLLHGLTASRDFVVHGSRTLEREGFRQIAYDARGHGESDPATPGAGYEYADLAADLAAVIDAQVGEERFVLAGHSMGAHTAIAYALADAGLLAGLVVIGPVFLDTYDQEVLKRWDRLADALETGGIDEFVNTVVHGLDPQWQESVGRFTRARMQKHRHLDAVAHALREVPRSKPLDSMSQLEGLDVPALVVASHDVADPHHPYAVAEAYAERLPRARLISEADGESPLAWQGGRLSREIASFGREVGVLA